MAVLREGEIQKRELRGNLPCSDAVDGPGRGIESEGVAVHLEPESRRGLHAQKPLAVRSGAAGDTTPRRSLRSLVFGEDRPDPVATRSTDRFFQQLGN